MKIRPVIAKLLARACCAALGAFVLGLCLIRAMKHFDSLDLAGTLLSGGFLLLALLWARRAAMPLATSETARQSARQFQWSCIFLSMLSLGFGIGVAGVIWYSADFVRKFDAAWFGALTCVGISPTSRDAKRLADAAGPG